MTFLRKIGGFHKTDPEGFLINESSLSLVRPPWREAVEEAKNSYLANMAGQIHSIYLRGNIARGLAVDGVSDVDTFAVTFEEVRSEDLSWVYGTKRDLKARHPFVTDFEFHVLPLQAVLKSYGYLSYRFIIKNLSVCLYGEDLALRLPRYKPSLSIAWAFHGNIGELIDKTLKKVQETEEPERIRGLCTRAMKRIVRTGFSMVMEEEKVYTRDLYFCYEVFSKHYPQKESEMRKALEWAIQPPDDKNALLAFLKDFGSWVSGEARERFKALNRK